MRTREERERVRKKKRKKMQKKAAAQGKAEDEASLTLTATEEIPFLSSISTSDKIRYIFHTSNSSERQIFTVFHMFCQFSVNSSPSFSGHLTSSFDL